jgi:uncharacterized protein YggT (Ycf19 family)
MDDNGPVATDEARRVAQHEAMKSHVERDVNADISARAEEPAPAEAPKLDSVARNIRGDAIKEVVVKNEEVSRARGLARGSGFIDYVFYLIYGLLAVRLVLAMLGAREGNGFVQLIDTVTNPFYGMFRGIVPNQTINGQVTVAVPVLIAIVAYALLHAAINGLLRTIANRKTEI